MELRPRTRNGQAKTRSVLIDLTNRKAAKQSHPTAKKQPERLALQVTKTEPLQNEDTDGDQRDPLRVPYYVKDIYEHLRRLETAFVVKKNYMDGYQGFSPSTRASLVDWMVQVHDYFRMQPDTLYLSVSVLDAFLQTVPSTEMARMHLTGVASVLIAAKFEETDAPSVADLVRAARGACTKEDVLVMELRILRSIDYRLGRPSPLHFLRRHAAAASVFMEHVGARHCSLAEYLMELALTEYGLCHHLPSELAAAAIGLSIRILDAGRRRTPLYWNKSMETYSGYVAAALEPLMTKLCAVLVDSDSKNLRGVRAKYNNQRYSSISAAPQLSSTFVKFMSQKASTFDN